MSNVPLIQFFATKSKSQEMHVLGKRNAGAVVNLLFMGGKGQWGD